MTSSPTGRRMTGLLLGGVLAGMALTGCTSAPASPTSPSPEVTSATPSPAASSSPSSSASATASPSPSESSAADAVTIDITIADGQVTPNGKKIDIDVGQTIVLNVTSDQHDEVHAHTEGDGFELEVPAGKKVSGEFTINSPGSYEVESHHLEKVIAILNAR
jgi:plastocyanin